VALPLRDRAELFIIPLTLSEYSNFSHLTYSFSALLSMEKGAK